MSSSSGVNLEKYRIPLEEINRATENFSPHRLVGDGGSRVYEGQLSENWKNRTVAIKRVDQYSREFHNELEIIAQFDHENVISLLGYCDEDSDMIIVYDYAFNRSLQYLLQDPNKMRPITWTQRLKICIGAARGLNYLHTGLGEYTRAINGYVTSANILLDDNFVAKNCNFGMSDLRDTKVFTTLAGTQFYLDPEYHENRIHQKKSDVYSLGVVLFEILAGMMVYQERSDGNEQQVLMSLVRRYQRNEPDKLIDPFIRDQIDHRSFDAFQEIAYQCISINLMKRPAVETVIKKIEEALIFQVAHSIPPLDPESSDQTLLRQQKMTTEPHGLKIPLQVIKNCTQEFNERNFIGKGGYGRVFKGILTWAEYVNQPVAVKRLDVTGFQGNKEFHTELTMLSQYQHENIITLVGFCDDDKEMILVYEYASHGSLDTYLRDTAMSGGLSWPQLLKICIGAASALDYLHNHVAEKHRIIHRDIKSANILLDKNWNAKLADFGLARIGLANQENTVVITNLAGTHGYCDPLYERTGFLTKESDVYSFGVVLFEVLCGRLACVYNYNDERRFLHHLTRTCYKNGELDKIIDKNIRKNIKKRTLLKFSTIAYQCLQKKREQRPNIVEVSFQLNEAMKIQLEDEILQDEVTV